MIVHFSFKRGHILLLLTIMIFIKVIFFKGQLFGKVSSTVGRHQPPYLLKIINNILIEVGNSITR